MGRARIDIGPENADENRDDLAADTGVTEDVEGHRVARYSDEFPTDDDVEGHGRSLRNTDETATDEDVEGHRLSRG